NDRALRPEAIRHAWCLLPGWWDGHYSRRSMKVRLSPRNQETTTMKKKVAVAFFLAILSLPAFAQYRLRDQPGLYAGGALGMNGDDEIAWRLLLGYQANRHFALEFGYHDLGKHNIAGFPLESNAVEVLAVGRLPHTRKGHPHCDRV